MAKEPEQIELTPQELKALQDRIKNFAITKEDIALFGKVLDFFVWVQSKLIRCQITIAQLKRIIFGSKTEKSKHSDLNKERGSPEVRAQAALTSEDNVIENTAPSGEDQPINHLSVTAQSSISTKPKAKGHGRIGADEYEPDEIIQVRHASLKAGDHCPTDCGGKLYQRNDKPGGIIRVLGQSCAHVVRYDFDKLRCALCGTVFTAEAPSDFPPHKYDAYFKADLVIQKYFMASPFYRQEQHQKLLGFSIAR